MFKAGNHPCFNEHAVKKYSRVHLPVAPECNIQCNYCNRKFDCANESRPGVTSRIMSPEQACEYLIQYNKNHENLSVVGFAGPGDALANFEKVKTTIALIKQSGLNPIFCLSTNGLLLPEYAEAIVHAGITHVTVTINAVNESLIPKIYEKINYKGENLPLDKGANILIKNQLFGLKKLSDSGVICKVNILCLNGINDNHIEEVVRVVKNHGAYMTNITRLIPAAGSNFENLFPVEEEKLNQIRKNCSTHLKQMYHCKQCRADAAGLLC